MPSVVEEGKEHMFREISNRERGKEKYREKESKGKNEMRVLGLVLVLFARECRRRCRNGVAAGGGSGFLLRPRL